MLSKNKALDDKDLNL